MSKYSLDNRSPITAQWPISDCTPKVQITNAVYVKEGNWECIDITFKTTTKVGEASFKDRLFKIDPQWVNANPNIDGDTKTAAVEREEKKLNTKLFHIVETVGVTSDQLNTIGGDSFRELAETYCKVLMENCTGVQVYLKTIANKSGYATLPKYTPFIQSMASGDCVLKYSKKERDLNTRNTAPKGIVTQSTIGDFGE